jgi:hypothetical protein
LLEGCVGFRELRVRPGSIFAAMNTVVPRICCAAAVPTVGFVVVHPTEQLKVLQVHFDTHKRIASVEVVAIAQLVGREGHCSG